MIVNLMISGQDPCKELRGESHHSVKEAKVEPDTTSIQRLW